MSDKVARRCSGLGPALAERTPAFLQSSEWDHIALFNALMCTTRRQILASASTNQRSGKAIWSYSQSWWLDQRLERSLLIHGERRFVLIHESVDPWINTNVGSDQVLSPVRHCRSEKGAPKYLLPAIGQAYEQMTVRGRDTGQEDFEESPTQSRISPSIQRILRLLSSE